MPQVAFIGVGSNLNQREEMIASARRLLTQATHVRFLRSAPIYETLPVGGPPQGSYLNTVWEIETQLKPGELLRLLNEIEFKLGRIRTEKNGPRTIDLDLLLYEDQVIETENLIIPHPRLHERWFVLKPLWDLRSDFVHPVFKKSICELLDQLDETHKKSKKN